MEKKNIVKLTTEEKNERSKLSQLLASQVKLPSCIYSYTRGKSVKGAIESVKKNINKYKYFTKLDIKNYFENIDCSILSLYLNNLVGKSLSSEIINILEDDESKYKKKGLIIGSPLSNILSNIYLMRFDKYISENANIKYYRFADDILILSDEKIKIKEIQKELDKDKLIINEKKVVEGSYGDTFLYLGEEIKKEKNFTFNEGEKLDNINELFEKKSLSDEEQTSLKVLAKQNDNKEYEYLYRYKIKNENLDDLIEEMISENLYKEIYKLHELIENTEGENSYRKFIELFNYTKGSFYKSIIVDGRLDYKLLGNIISTEDFDSHILGDFTIAKKLNDENLSNILVIDIDNKGNLNKAKTDAAEIQKILSSRGVDSYLEYSGMKGYHIWIFFDECIEIQTLNIWIEKIINKKFESSIEIRPKSPNISDSEQIIKLPLGKHPVTKELCNFLDISAIEDISKNHFVDSENKVSEFWSIVEDEFESLANIAKNCSIVKEIILLKEVSNRKIQRIFLT